MDSLLYVAFIFFVIALILAVAGPYLGISPNGSAMSFKIAVIFLVLFVVLLLLSLLVGGSPHFAF